MGVLIQTGRYPLTIDGQLRCIHNWIRIMGRGGCSDLLLITEDMAQKDDSYCLIALKKFLKENNLQVLFEKIINIQQMGKTIRTLKEYLIQTYLSG